MDIDNNYTDNKRRYKLQMKIYETLQIASNSTMIALWNTYQLFLYANSDFYSTPVLFEPCFKLREVILDKNCIICLDFSDNIHSIPLKLKSGLEKLQIPYRPQIHNVIAFIQLNEFKIVTLQEDYGKYSLCIYKTSDMGSVTKTFYIDFQTEIKSTQNIVFKSYLITDLNKECLKSTFEENIEETNHLLLIILDERTVLSTILNENCVNDRLCVSKLFYSPSDIRDAEINGINEIELVIGLKLGTVVKLKFGPNQKPQILHLNIPIHKFIVINKSIFYSDGNTMWKNDNYKKQCFKEIFVKQARDFIQFNNQIVCVTYLNTIYTFPYEDEAIYICSELEEKFQPVEKVVIGINVLFDEMKKNNEIVEKIKRETNKTLAIALSTRSDIYKNAINHTITVINSFEEANTNVFLTNLQADYFNPNSILILIKLQFRNDIDMLKEAFNNLKQSLKLHILFSTDDLVTSLSLDINNFTESAYLVPFNANNIVNIKISLKLVCPIDSSNKNEPVWIILYARDEVLTSEQFIKVSKSKQLLNMKEQYRFDDLVITTCKNQHGGFFEFSTTKTENNNEYMYYLKLDSEYEKVLGDINTFNSLSNKKAEFLSKKLGSVDFLNQNHVILLHIQSFKVTLQIVRENNEVLLKIAGDNARVCFDIRSYLDKLLCKNRQTTQWIPQAQYTSLEDLRRKLVQLQYQRDPSDKLILNVADHFNKKYLLQLL